MRSHAVQQSPAGFAIANLSPAGGAARIGFASALAGAVATNVQTVLRGFVTPEMFGAVGDGVADDQPALQAMWDAIEATGGTIRLTAPIYRCDTPLDWRKASATGLLEGFYVVDGNGSTIDFSNMAADTGTLVKFGATSQANSQESGKWVMRNLRVIGKETGAIGAADARTTDILGIDFTFALNLVLENIYVLGCFKGYHTNFCFPINAKNVIAHVCVVGLHVGSDCTTGTWDDCGGRNGRFSLLLQPDTVAGVVAGQEFNGWNFEGCQVGGVLDPLDGSGVGIRNISFNNPYLEGNAKSGFRVGRAFDVSDAAVEGADRSRDTCYISWTGGTWDGGTWGTSGHDAIICQSSSPAAPPYGLHIEIPVNRSGLDLAGARDYALFLDKDFSVGFTDVNLNTLAGEVFAVFPCAGGTGAIAADLAANCTVEKTAGTGEFRVNFTAPFKGANSFIAQATTEGSGKLYVEISAKSASAVTLRTYNDVGTLTDPTRLHVSVRGVQ